MELPPILDILFTNYCAQASYAFPTDFEPLNQLILEKPVSEQDVLFRAVLTFAAAMKGRHLFRGLKQGSGWPRSWERCWKNRMPYQV